ncbi:uncharacterized protein LOC126784292 [Argentina anserina]|uniref:uncharacterized protein LOC126784292 n=1 Tax=Argentina anserina TaxID=57926 RepID=UPI002176816A|nr:uncharacterized protein LOC126784292 [Potentilla anserina]
MSRSYGEQPPPPPPPQEFVIQGGEASTYSPHGSIGAVVGVLVMVVILAVVAVVIGRLCSGKTIMGYGHFDMESWAETKCSSCIDGRISISLSRPNVSTTTPPAQPSEQSEAQTSAPSANT